jgi:VanZ family protein
VKARARWTVVSALALGILVASLVPGAGLAARGPLGVVGLDMWLHALAYLGLSAAVTWADGRPLVGVAAAVAYGIVVELLQVGVPYRSGSALDAVANLAGALVGAALVVALAAVASRLGGSGGSDAAASG